MINLEVNIVVRLPDRPGSLIELIKPISDNGGNIFGILHFVIIITGHVFDTDVPDTIKRLAAKGIKTTELQAKFTELEDVSNVRFKFEVPETIEEKEFIEELKKICDEKDLSLIRA